MIKKSDEFYPSIYLIGDDKLTLSIAKNLEHAGQGIQRLSQDQDWPNFIQCDLVIVVTDEILAVKQNVLRRLENCVQNDAIIAINTESFSLEGLLEGSSLINRTLGVNWSYPVEHSFFLEIISHAKTEDSCVDFLVSLAKDQWGKDPYLCKGGFSIRGRLMAALAREAFYLVDNEYATMESIDRSCRNDAGYYMPFVGNFRYMDLMGTAVYGIVMDTLNKDLSTQKELSENFFQLKDSAGQMDSDVSFYQYESEDAEKWQQINQEFAVKIRQLMENYPITFNY